MSGTVIDKATALKHSVSGSSINKIVCKASSHDLAGPKKKHVDYLLAMTNNPHANMVTIADMLSERMHNSSWVVVFKALITSHTLITLGNEKYLQALATRSNPFDLESFSDRSTVQATEMTPFIHRYSRYLGAVCSSYRTIVIDFFRMARGDNGPFRTMEAGKLLKAAGLIQNVLDKLVDFDATSGELNNGIINTAFTILYQDLTKIYAAYNDAMINVLEHFFEMKKTQCKEAVECYRKFLIRQESVQKFLVLAEEVGIDKKRHLNLRQVPEDLLPALEQHLDEMDAIRKAATTTSKQPSPQIQAASAKLSELKSKSPTSNSGSNSPAPTSSPFVPIPSANEEILSAQRKRFEELKRRASDKNLKVESTSGTASKTESPLPEAEEDEFTAMATSRSTPQPQQKSTTSSSVLDELIGLDTQWNSVGGASTGGGNTNPWAPAPSVPSIPSINTNPFAVGGATGGTVDPWGGSGVSGYQEIGMFSSQPAAPTTTSSANGLADILQPMSTGPFASQQPQPQAKKLTTDVDSSLALAATNLSLELGGGGTSTGTGLGSGIQKKQNLVWGADPTQQKPTLTGGPGYQGQRQLQPTTLPPGPGQMGGMGMMGQPTGGVGMYGGYFPAQQQPTVQPQNPFGMQPMGGFGYQSGFPPQQMFPQQSPFQSNPQQPSLF